MPDELFSYGFAPHFARAAHAPEEASSVNTGDRRPLVRGMHPVRNRNCPNLAGRSAQVYHCPMPLSLLLAILLACGLRRHELARLTFSHLQITFPYEPFPVVGCLPERVRLFGGQPVAEPYAQVLYASDPSYSCTGRPR